MNIRIAGEADIAGMHAVRTSVRGNVWLTTTPDTRAERFYTTAGWRPAGTAANCETRFEMSRPLP